MICMKILDDIFKVNESVENGTIIKSYRNRGYNATQSETLDSIRNRTTGTFL